jgi:hypothetical protein
MSSSKQKQIVSHNGKNFPWEKYLFLVRSKLCADLEMWCSDLMSVPQLGLADQEVLVPPLVLSRNSEPRHRNGSPPLQIHCPQRQY